jgi:hypothetical protein
VFAPATLMSSNPGKLSTAKTDMLMQQNANVPIIPSDDFVFTTVQNNLHLQIRFSTQIFL